MCHYGLAEHQFHLHLKRSNHNFDHGDTAARQGVQPLLCSAVNSSTPQILFLRWAVSLEMYSCLCVIPESQECSPLHRKSIFLTNKSVLFNWLPFIVFSVDDRTSGFFFLLSVAVCTSCLIILVSYLLSLSCVSVCSRGFMTVNLSDNPDKRNYKLLYLSPKQKHFRVWLIQKERVEK